MSLPSFDEYCEQHHSQQEEYGQAFAAYLHETSGWDGDAEKVEDEQRPIRIPAQLYGATIHGLCWSTDARVRRRRLQPRR